MINRILEIQYIENIIVILEWVNWKIEILHSCFHLIKLYTRFGQGVSIEVYKLKYSPITYLGKNMIEDY